MFAIPIGLEAQARKFPFFTIGLLSVTVMVSVVNFPSIRRFGKQMAENPAHKAVLQSRQSLALAACDQELRPEQCRVLRAALRPNRHENTEIVYSRLQEKTTEAHRRSDLKKLLRYIYQKQWSLETKGDVRALPEFKTFMTANASAVTAKTNLARKFGLLSRNTLSPATLLRAQFLHAGWLHLISNMIFFLIFAIPLEERLGPAGLLSLYFVGGTLGLATQIYSFSLPAETLIGASANVFALAAGYMLAFRHLSTKVWVSFLFIVNQMVRIRTWFFIPALFLANEVTAALAPTFSNVAHIAHVAGFAFGALLSLILLHSSPLSDGFAYPIEETLYKRSKKSTLMKEKLQYLEQILSLHPGCLPALKESLDLIATWPAHWAELPPYMQQYLSLHIRQMSEIPEFNGGLIQLMSVTDWPFQNFISSNLVSSAFEYALELKSKNTNAAVRLLEILIEAEKNAQAKQSRSSRVARAENINHMMATVNELKQKVS